MQLDRLVASITDDLYGVLDKPLTEEERERILIWLHFQAMHSLAHSSPHARFEPARRQFAARVLEQRL